MWSWFFIIYLLLLPLAPSPYKLELVCDLQCKFTDEQLHHLCRLTHFSLVDTKTQENSYKLLLRWYCVPATLTRIYPSPSDLCWMGCDQRGTFPHMWWDCPVIVNFWSTVHKHIMESLDIDLPPLPKHLLLHIPTTPLSHYQSSALFHLLNAGIPVHWKSSHVPSEQDWIGKVKVIMEVEEWIVTCRGNPGTFWLYLGTMEETCIWVGLGFLYFGSCAVGPGGSYILTTCPGAPTI